MQVATQQHIVKNAFVRANANVMPAKSAPSSVSGAKAGSRFLSFLIAALGAWAV